MPRNGVKAWRKLRKRSVLRYGVGALLHLILTCHRLKKPMEQAWLWWKVWN